MLKNSKNDMTRKENSIMKKTPGTPRLKPSRLRNPTAIINTTGVDTREEPGGMKKNRRLNGAGKISARRSNCLSGGIVNRGSSAIDDNNAACAGERALVPLQMHI
jgi:hypothetical protein